MHTSVGHRAGWKSKDSFWESVFSCNVVPGIELRLSGMLASTLTCWAISSPRRTLFNTSWWCKSASNKSSVSLFSENVFISPYHPRDGHKYLCTWDKIVPNYFVCAGETAYLQTWYQMCSPEILRGVFMHIGDHFSKGRPLPFPLGCLLQYGSTFPALGIYNFIGYL